MHLDLELCRPRRSSLMQPALSEPFGAAFRCEVSGSIVFGLEPMLPPLLSVFLSPPSLFWVVGLCCSRFCLRATHDGRVEARRCRNAKMWTELGGGVLSELRCVARASLRCGACSAAGSPRVVPCAWHCQLPSVCVGSQSRRSRPRSWATLLRTVALQS